jgi:hypothetical protein
MSYLKKQFLKLVNLKKTQAPSPVVQSAPTAVKVDVSNPFVKYLATYGDDLWAVQKGENINLTMADMGPAKAAGFTKTEAFASQWAQGRPVEPANSERSRTSLSFGIDNGKIFKAPPGTTTYHTWIPPDNQYALAFCLALDGEDHVDKHATLKVDNGPEQDVSNEMGPVAVVADPGFHTFEVTCNYELSVQIQYHAK